MDNKAIARTLEDIADLAEIAGDNPHKIRAYRKVASAIVKGTDDVAALSRAGKVTSLAGVGKGIGAVLDEIVATGTSAELATLQERVPATLLDVSKIAGLGPNKVRALWETLGITSVGEVIQACRENRLTALTGFGKKTQEKVLTSALFVAAGAGRFVLGKARSVGVEIAAALEAAGIRSRLAGEAARGLEITSGVSLVAADGDLTAVLGALGEVRREGALWHLAFGKIPVVVTSAPADTFEGAWVLGSSDEAHAAWLGEQAGGAFAEKVRGATSAEEVYDRLGLGFVPVELREGAAPEVPDDLVSPGDLEGCFHVHTEWSDGSATVDGMVSAAAKNGYKWVGISDHSQAAFYANGLGGDRLAEQRIAIEAARAKHPKMRVLHGIEVDILEDGRLDLDDAVLGQLDFVVASVHSQLRLDDAAMTARLVKAVSHPLVTLLGHPRGRLLLSRKGSGFDLDEVAKAAAAHGTALEINASPERMDLGESDVRTAKARGTRFAISPDAHSPAAFENQSLGLSVARRARLRRGDVLNAGPTSDVLAGVAKERARHQTTA